MGFASGSDGKESACSAGGPGSIPGSGRSPGEGNGNPLQYSYLENTMDRGAWWATVHGGHKTQLLILKLAIQYHSPGPSSACIDSAVGEYKEWREDGIYMKVVPASSV